MMAARPARAATGFEVAATEFDIVAEAGFTEVEACRPAVGA